MSKQNIVCWVDIPVIDLDRAIHFYTAVLKKAVTRFNEHGFEFGLLPHEEENVSGCLAVMPDRQPSQSGPLIYLNVEGYLDEAVEMVDTHGGKVLKEIEQIGPYGHRALILDTEGNGVALYSKERKV